MRAPGSARRLALLTAAVLVGGLGLVAPAAARATTSGNVVSSGGTAAALWPASPDWQQYVEAPKTRDVHPVAVVSTAGQVINAGVLAHPGSAGSATLTRIAADSGPTDIVLDYGKDVGGLPEFTVSAETGSPKLQAGYAEALSFLTPTGDGGTPFGSGDPSRSDSYAVTGPGTIVNRYVQGGERYQEISLTSPGSVALSAAEIYDESYLGSPSTYQGHFVSSSTALNRIWYDGAYTVNTVQMRPDTPGGNWLITDGALSADGGGVGQLTTGSDWTDYTMSFHATIDQNQAGWVGHSQSHRPGHGPGRNMRWRARIHGPGSPGPRPGDCWSSRDPSRC